MSVGPCFNMGYEGCIARKSIGHHIYWPRREYATELEKAFRGLPQHIVQMCACVEQQIHLQPPPAKPSVYEMITALSVEFSDGAPS